MHEWTEAARTEFQRYLDRARSSLNAPPGETGEVLDDLRRHIEEEVHAAGLMVVTEEDIRRITTRLGLPESAADRSQAHPGPSPTPALIPPQSSLNPGMQRWSLGFLLIFGTVMPLIALLFEWISGLCAAAFFDPLPTVAHALLVGSVPAANLLVWLAVAGRLTLPHRRLVWVSGFALGVAGYYALQFLPMAPFAAIGIVYLGLGLLPLSPLLALLSGVFLRRRLRHLAAAANVPRPRAWPAVVIGFLALVTLNAPVWLTRAGVQWATSDDPAREIRGLQWLRTFGHEETLLRACYGRGRGAAGLDPVEWFFDGPPPAPEVARVLYYRVTGRAFNTVPAPRVRTGRGAFADLNDWTWDTDQGGDAVGGRIKSLSLHSSRLEATLEPGAAIGYGEWTLEFKNDGTIDREARAQVLLPPGAVVSRLTLWVDGQEREAAFAGRAQVREAYQQVAIRQRRDPVLVNTCGPDRILVQCYPVPRDGGLIKIRLGFTAPLSLDADGQGHWHWPAFLERNFNIRESLRHALWIQSPSPLIPRSSLFQPGPDAHSWRARLRESELADPSAAFKVARRSTVTTAWVHDTRAPLPAVVRQSLSPRPLTRPSKLLLVLDGSAAMRAFLEEISSVFARLGDQLEPAGIIIATDEPTWILDAREDPRSATNWVARLRRAPLQGGHDNVPALLEAWDATGGAEGSLIVWIHGPQPVEIHSPESLRQCWERGRHQVHMVSFPTSPGPNVLLQKLDGISTAWSFPRQGTLTEDLQRLLSGGHPDGSTWERSLELVDSPPAGPDVAEASLHLARLWGAHEVRRLQQARRYDEGVQLAARYQLVTPVTGAVVLETARQFADHQLTPADPLTVPAIPEPTVGALALLGFLLWACRRRASNLKPHG
jgi:hypothetical protein